MNGAPRIVLLLLLASHPPVGAEPARLEEEPAVHALGRGAFPIGSDASRVDGRSGLVRVQAKHDTMTRDSILEGTFEVTLGRLAIRAGALYDAAGSHPALGARFDVLREERDGLDATLDVAYESRGFSPVPAVVSRIGIGRTFGVTQLLASAAYAAGLEEGERSGGLQARALRPVHRRVYLGIEGGAALDLERDADEPPGEFTWQARLTPLLGFAVRRFLVSAGAGVTTGQLRLVDGQRTGVIVMTGFAGVF